MDQRYTGFNQNSNNSRSRKSGGSGGVFAIVWIVVVLINAVSEGGAVFLIPIAIIATVAIAIIIPLIRQSKASQSSSPASPSYPAVPSYPAASSYSAASNPQAKHLCEDPKHASEDAASKESLTNMEAGYSSYSTPSGYTAAAVKNTSQPNYRRERVKRLSREQFEKKQAELHDLLAAGIISDKEYREKISEYRNYSAF